MFGHAIDGSDPFGDVFKEVGVKISQAVTKGDSHQREMAVSELATGAHIDCGDIKPIKKTKKESKKKEKKLLKKLKKKVQKAKKQKKTRKCSTSSVASFSP